MKNIYPCLASTAGLSSISVSGLFGHCNLWVQDISHQDWGHQDQAINPKSLRYFWCLSSIEKPEDNIFENQHTRVYLDILGKNLANCKTNFLIYKIFLHYFLSKYSKYWFVANSTISTNIHISSLEDQQVTSGSLFVSKVANLLVLFEKHYFWGKYSKYLIQWLKTNVEGFQFQQYISS